jgi:hypothetical protein
MKGRNHDIGKKAVANLRMNRADVASQSIKPSENKIVDKVVTGMKKADDAAVAASNGKHRRFH